MHFDQRYADKTEWKKLLVDSTFTLALVTGMSVNSISDKVVVNLGWDEVRLPTQYLQVIRSMLNQQFFQSVNQKAVQPKRSSLF
ncbi:MaoC-like dehydratase domain protein [Mycoplasmoides gallisepticum CA06_2006.052-5-2P]|uniref:MaoC-like dehydratase domain protein n=1 Tax=Mycoplasmoides gallisepticum WI01_2001.043-13-2P TaxID=1159201 RepID=J3YHQ9_MYCGL|nr:MaoC-like dehydratase domain protein [Mycoplasmoides gallisepticum VA94_7994-1-7P]AFP77085.1 MaoC-like dehydratase domain protein [Mycoplasmoides gallisepticum NC95_13295-2-2P]AFP77843.1 MaoC-like dehydratase domain protein [Mycoplasmoides gallisepticum NC96_1596-4-2P]AFP78609.1 MaoC-like dehydratase domain protein [Mycoplasmoides gallisepticum NY01_2001.047-5-1P]AFP79370.1 MaoC-like dehydratase domain protein [Mycoplasmoides gallisepticum WI01_2001.043-13-2P]AFP80108.1 MaoC-like dehydratas